MRRFGTATVLGGLLLLGGSWSLSATDTPKKAPGHTRRKAVASKQTSNADVKLDNLYVDAEIGQVFTVNLGRADQPGSGGENVASVGSVQVYQLGGSEIEPPTSAEVAGQADPVDSAAPADDDETGPAAEEMQPADGPAEGDEAMEPAADDPAEEPAAEPAAAPQTSQSPSQPDPGAAQQPAAPAAKAAPKTPPPAAAPQAPPPPPPPIR